MNVKKISVLLMTVLVFVLTSCKSGNSTDPVDNNLEGTWVLTKIYLTEVGNLPIDPAEYGISGSFVLSKETFTVTFTFPGDNDPEVETGTWNVADGKIYLQTSSGDTEEMPFTLSGNKLSVKTVIEIPGFGDQQAKLEFTKQ